MAKTGIPLIIPVNANLNILRGTNSFPTLNLPPTFDWDTVEPASSEVNITTITDGGSNSEIVYQNDSRTAKINNMPVNGLYTVNKFHNDYRIGAVVEKDVMGRDVCVEPGGEWHLKFDSFEKFQRPEDAVDAAQRWVKDGK